MKSTAASAINGAIGTKLPLCSRPVMMPADMNNALLMTAAANTITAFSGEPASAPHTNIIFISPAPIAPEP